VADRSGVHHEQVPRLGGDQRPGHRLGRGHEPVCEVTLVVEPRLDRVGRPGLDAAVGDEAP